MKKNPVLYLKLNCQDMILKDNYRNYWPQLQMVHRKQLSPNVSKHLFQPFIKLLMISRRKIWQISNKIILAIHIDVACHKMLSYIISTLVQNRPMYLKSESMYLIMVFAISIGGELAQKFLVFDFANCCTAQSTKDKQCVV